MQLRLRHYFIATAVVAVWTWAYLAPTIPAAKYTAAVFTVLATFGCSWMTLTALVASLASLVEFQTCGCGYIATWNALPVTILACILGWCGACYASKAAKVTRLVAICVAITATSVVIRNLEDLFIRGHRPIWPDSPIAESLFPAANDAALPLSLLTAFATAICVVIGRGLGWLLAQKKGQVQ